MVRVARARFHPDAVAEFDAATDWYREKSELAAETFVSEVDQAIARIIQRPLAWATYLYGTRRALLRHFPYAVVYLLNGDQIEIVAVAHGRRRPGYWKTRLNVC